MQMSTRLLILYTINCTHFSPSLLRHLYIIYIDKLYYFNTHTCWLSENRVQHHFPHKMCRPHIEQLLIVLGESCILLCLEKCDEELCKMLLRWVYFKTPAMGPAFRILTGLCIEVSINNLSNNFDESPSLFGDFTVMFDNSVTSSYNDFPFYFWSNAFAGAA